MISRVGGGSDHAAGLTGMLRAGRENAGAPRWAFRRICVLLGNFQHGFRHRMMLAAATRMNGDFDITVIGAGIIGLACARACSMRFPDARLCLIDKESGPAQHQSGRNSGVLHSGVYYRPGSEKSRHCARGRQLMLAFCAEHGIAVDRLGKLIVARTRAELAGLRTLQARAEAQDIEVHWVSRSEIPGYEPYVRGEAALHVPSAASVDYRGVCARMLSILRQQGAEVVFGCTFLGAESEPRTGLRICSNRGDWSTQWLINCAGLHVDRISQLCGGSQEPQIVPFRGEYFELPASRVGLCSSMVYPVPDPNFPFLGVHLTRGVDGRVHIGPNAVLALAREGYDWKTVNLRDLKDIALHPGFWRLAGKHLWTGLGEMHRSWFRSAMLKEVQKMLPAIELSDLQPMAAGVRAQALARSGTLVDDFVVQTRRRIIDVRNAPSPAATSSFSIAEDIVDRVELQRRASSFAGR